MKEYIVADVRNLLNSFEPFNRLGEIERLESIQDVLSDLSDHYCDLQAEIEAAIEDEA
jgi:hypothetical protein